VQASMGANRQVPASYLTSRKTGNGSVHVEMNWYRERDPFRWHFLWSGRQRGSTSQQGYGLLVKYGRARAMHDPRGEHLPPSIEHEFDRDDTGHPTSTCFRGVAFVSVDVGNERSLPIGLRFRGDGGQPGCRCGHGIGGFRLRRWRRGGHWSGIRLLGVLVGNLFINLLLRLFVLIGLRLR